MYTPVPAEYNLKNIKNICPHLNGIEYFLFYGTLLGYQRSNNVIDGDDDIDILVDLKYRNKILKILEKLGYNISINNPYFIQGAIKIDGVETFSDFYLYENDVNKKYIIDRWACYGSVNDSRCHLHVPKNIIFPTKMGKMQNIDVRLPAKVKETCQFLYGENYNIPIKKNVDYMPGLKNNKPFFFKLDNNIDVRTNIVIVTYNSSKTIKKCIDSILNNFSTNTKITVVDNNSRDGTLNILENYKDSIFVVKNNRNIGFSAGVNKGLDMGVKYNILLNPDTIVFKGWIKGLISKFDEFSNVAAVGPISNYGASNQNIRNYYDDNEIHHLSNNPEKINENILLNLLFRYSEPVISKLLNGFCMAISTDALNKIGCLDEELFLGNNDLDISWKFQLNGLKTIIATDVFVFQKGQVSFKNDKKKKTDELVQSSTDILNNNLINHYGENNVPTPKELWGIDWFYPTKKSFNPFSKIDSPFNDNIDCPKISIIVLSYNAFSFTKKCVESILNNTFINYELIIFDNGSKKDTIDGLKLIKKKYPDIKIIYSNKNLGFAKGNNKAFKHASGEFVCFVNNDTLLPYGWLSALYNSLKLDSRIGAVGPVSNSVSGRQKIIQEYELSDFFNYSKERIIKKNNITPRRRLAGLVVMLPSEIYQSIGGFSEDFKIGNYEDDDLSLKIRDLGYALMVNESVYVHHFGSQTFKANNIDHSATMKDGELIFKRKWPQTNYNELLEMDNNLIDLEKKLIEKGFEFLNNQHFRKALEPVERILKFNPISEEALFLKSIIYTSTEKFEPALETAKKLISINNTNSEAYNQLGIIYLFLSKTTKAIKCFDKAIASKPDWIEPYKLKSESLVRINEINKAYETLIEIVNIFGEDESTLNRIIQILQIAGEKKEAEKWLKILNSQSHISQAQEKFI